MLDICLLGCGGMMPLPHRALTSCMVRSAGTSLLIDCGEGTQVQLHAQGWSFKSIDGILITHYHGDHVAGLPGLLLTIGNSGRTEPLHIYGPRGLSRIVHGLMLIAPELPFEVECHEISGNPEEKLQIGCFTVSAFRVEHGMPCFGYRVDLLRRREFLPEQAKANGVPLMLWSKLQKGMTMEQDGRVYTPDMVLGKERKGLSLCYVTDSVPVPAIAENARGVDLMICEGMYGEEERSSRANEYKHMTFKEAATLAKEAGAGELWLTHYSPSLIRPKEVLPEAREIFPATECGKDLLCTTLLYEDE